MAHAQAMEPPEGGIVRADEKPAILKDIGIDQRLNEQLPLDLPFKDEAGRDVRLGDYFGQQAGRPRARLLRLPDALHAGAERPVGALERAVARAGKDFEVVTVSFDPRDTPALAAAKKDAYLDRYKRPGRRGRLALPDRRRSRRSSALTKAAGFRYVWDEEHEAVRARRAAIMVATPDGPARALLLRHRVRAARPAARARRGVGRQDRHARRSAPALLLPLRPGDRQVRRVAS